jgi:hypothetical protein
METLKIEKNAALTAHDQATPKQKTMLENLFGKNVFSKNIRDRIQSEADIFELNSTTEEEFNEKWKNHSEQEKAHGFELLIVSAYCGNKLPDMTDGTSKYAPWFKMGSPAGVGFAFNDYDRWLTCSSVGSRQLFHGSEAYENMMDAVEKFLPHYQRSRTL